MFVSKIKVHTSKKKTGSLNILPTFSVLNYLENYLRIKVATLDNLSNQSLE